MKNKFLTVFTIFALLLISGCVSLSVTAETVRADVYNTNASAGGVKSPLLTTGRKVRVGYYTTDPAFQSGYSDSERKTGYAYEYYQAISVYTGWEYEYVYGSKDEIKSMLAKGDIDITAGIEKYGENTDSYLFSEMDMGQPDEKMYFALAAGRDDLKEELDTAMRKITEANTNFMTPVQRKYYGNNSYQALTESEREWLSEKGTLTIGYLNNDLPYSGTDKDGNTTGLIVDITEYLGKRLKVNINTVSYNSITEMENALVAGETDAAFPISADLWLNETRGVRQTNSFVSDRVMVIYKDSYTENLMERIALCNVVLSDEKYSSAEKVFYDSPKEMLDALAAGKEKCIIGCASIFQRLLSSDPAYSDLSVAYLDEPQDFGMVVKKDNIVLTRILNKTINQIDSARITDLMIKYAGVSGNYSFKEFIRNHYTAVIIFFIAAFSLLLLMFALYFRRMRQFGKEQEKSQAALAKALEDANSANKAKTDFLSSMSHDIRTPMNAISGMAEIASKNLDNRKKVADCLDKINISSRHLLTLINDVLDISKIESNNLPMNPACFSLSDIMTSLMEIVRFQFKSKKINFDLRVHNIRYERLYADEVRVSQIFINILSNALKYTPEGGRVSVDLYEEPLPDDDTVRLLYIVEDTGMGMTPEFMKDMYSAFSRAQDSRTNKIQGTGLGLSIVKSLVDAMGGTIDCISEPDKGTTFTVTLNLPIGGADIEYPPLPPMNVLIVDSDEDFTEKAVYTLEEMGVHADIAADTVKAVSYAMSEKKYSLLIADSAMSDVSLSDSIRMICDAAGEILPVIAVSTFDLTVDNSALEYADAIVYKQLFANRIREEISRLLKIEESPASDGGTEENLEGKHFLVAEDNDLNWEVISELLMMKGMTSERAENGKICVRMLEKAENGKYDAILMDIQMPVMNGREATAEIRKFKDRKKRTIPIIAMTADAFAEDIAACKAAGMDAHVSKPIDMDVLCRELRKIFFNKVNCD